MKRTVSRITISVLLLIGMLAFEFNIQIVAAANADHYAIGYDNREDSVSQVMATSSESARVLLITTMGNIVIGLFDDMPITAGNFENLTQRGIYDDTIFHRIVHNFVIQGGDVSGKGIIVPTIPDELPNKHSNVRGSVAMAKTSSPNSAASQFYINLVDNLFLDSYYSVFGHVVQGMDVVDSIGNVQTDPHDRPLQDVTILNAQLLPALRTWIVDDDGPADFHTIQGAINSPQVMDGDAIFVHNGTYPENVVVNKEVLLIGESREATVIDGGGNGIVLDINSNNVTATGFTVENSGLGLLDAGISLFYFSYGTIAGNVLTSNRHGLWIYGSNSNTVKGNKITSNMYTITLEQANNNTVESNTITSNEINGISLWYSSTNRISKNNFSNSGSDGVYFYSSNNNIVNGNTMTNNAVGAFLASSNGNMITNNIMTNNTSFSVWADNCSINTISNNTMTDSGEGILLQNNCTRNFIEGNIISNDTWDGIVLTEDSDENVISKNSLKNNRYGMVLMFSSDGNKIFHNNFLNNSEQVYIFNSTNTWDDEYPSGGNYWSNYVGVDLHKGPFQNIAGSDGLGDTPYGIDVNNIDHYPFMNQDGWLNSTSMQFTLNPNPAYVGQTDVLLGNLTDRFGNPLNNTKIDLFVNGNFAGSLSTNSSGWFTASAKVTSAGTFNVAAYYYGSQNYRPSSHTEILTVSLATITIWTDKTVYHVGDTMKVYVRVRNGASPLPVRAIITLKLPNGNLYTVLNMTTTLPANYDSSDVLWNTFTIPTVPIGNYTWIAELRNPTTGVLINQSTSDWQLSATATLETLVIDPMPREGI
jgi:peptidylprolyl isomerase